MTLVRLGMHLLRSGGRNAVLRLSLLAVGAAVSCFVVLTVIGLSQLADRQDARDAATMPRYPDAPGPAVEAGVTPIRFVEMIDGWRSTDLERIVVTDVGDNAPTPPGVDRLPQPGEVVLSPALRRLADAEPTVAQRFPQQIIGSIGDAGLTEPDALVAYVGVSPSELANGLVTSAWGTSQPGVSTRDPGANRTVGLFLLAFLLVPIGVFLSTCARLSANARDQRLSSLRLLGLTTRRTQIVNSIEIGVGAFTGAAVGLAAFMLVTHTARSAQIGRLSFFVADIRVDPILAAGAAASIGVVALVVAASSSQAGITQPLQTRRERGVRSVRPRRIIPLVIGIILLSVSWNTAGDSGVEVANWLIPFGIGLALTAVGIATAAPFVSIAVSRVLERIDRPSTLLAAGRLRHEPGAGARLIAALSVSVFALGFAFNVLAVIDASQYGNEVVTTDTATLIALLPDDTEIADVEGLDGILVAAPIRMNGSPDINDPSGVVNDADILVATCATARQLSGLPLPDCAEGNTYRLVSTTYAEDDNVFVPMVPAGLPEPIATLGFDFLRPDGDTVAFLTPPDGNTKSNEIAALVDAGLYNNQPDLLVATLAEQFPGGYWVVGINDGGAAAVFAGYQGMVIVGASSALIIGLLALIVATIDRATDRRREIARLTAIGAPRTTLKRAHLWQTLPVTTIIMLIAGAASLIGGSSYVRFGGDGITDVPIQALVIVAATAIIGSAAASLFGLIAMTPGNQTAHLRDE